MLPIVAHVDYVTDPDASPDPIGFFVEAISRPETLVAVALGAALVIGAVLGWARWRPLEEPRRRLVARAESYWPYLPWMVRLSAGLVLIGAGLGRALFLPTLDASGFEAFALTAIGFLLLLGFAVRPAALAGLALYVVVLVAHPEAVMILDVAGALALAAVLGPVRRASTTCCAPRSRAGPAREPRPSGRAAVSSASSCRCWRASAWAAPSPRRGSSTSC